MIWFISMIICAAAVYLIVCLIISRKVLKMVTHAVRYSTDDVRKLEIKNGFSDAVEAYEKKWKRTPIEIVSNGAVLSGEWIENPDASAEHPKAAVICHGHTVNRYSSLKYAEIFYRLGYQVIIYDERYFGASTGESCTLGQLESKDLVNVIAWARNQFGEACIIGLHGESMGAATVLLAMQEGHPDFVIADCPFADAELLLKQFIPQKLHLPFWPLVPMIEAEGMQSDFRIKEISPIKTVSAVNIPICFMHGKDDHLIPCTHSEMMYSACKNPKSVIHLFPGADHAYSIVTDRKDYEQEMAEFIKNAEEK